jgi:hypothetical protein
MKRIFDCGIFNEYVNKKYEVNVNHKIFGENKMKCVINGLIDEDNKVGIVVHGKEIFCYKQDCAYRFTEKNDRVIVSDNLMEIDIHLLN